jgi:molybdate transport system ATP-binding protein
MSGVLSVTDLLAVRGDFRLRIDRLRVAPGEILGVMGTSGSGKSTLLQAIAGFVPLRSGEIRLGENRLETLPAERRRIAMVFQRPALFPHLTVADNVEFALRVQGVVRAERRRRAVTWLQRLGIAELAGRLPHQISEGQGQRAAIARALIAGFPGLLLDEPFSALDPANRRALRTAVGDLVRETKVAAILVTHDAADARELATEAIGLEAGAIAWRGPASELPG